MQKKRWLATSLDAKTTRADANNAAPWSLGLPWQDGIQEARTRTRTEQPPEKVDPAVAPSQEPSTQEERLRQQHGSIKLDTNYPPPTPHFLLFSCSPWSIFSTYGRSQLTLTIRSFTWSVQRRYGTATTTRETKSFAPSFQRPALSCCASPLPRDLLCFVCAVSLRALLPVPAPRFLTII